MLLKFFGTIKCSVIITVLFLIFTGPCVFIWLVFAIPFHYFAMSKGRLTVRAFVYLVASAQGANTLQANNQASAIGFHAAAELAPHAMQTVNQYYGGNQLAFISHARMNGFAG